MSSLQADQQLGNLETTFEWREPRMRQRLRLLMFLGIAVLIHAGCFYVFQVVYPSSTRGIPVPMKMIVLNPDDVVSQDILRDVEDRVVGYGIDPGNRAVTVSLDAYNHYQPSFVGYRPKLRELPQGSIANMPLPGAFEEDVLPPVAEPVRESPALPSESSTGPTEPEVILDEALTRRAIVRQPALGILFEKAHGSQAIFKVAVNRAGIVEHCLLTEDEYLVDQLEALQKALFEFQFAPTATGELVWGTVTIEW